MIHVVHLTSVHPRSDVRIRGKECASLARAGYRVTLVVADDLGEELTDEGIRILDVGRSGLGRIGRMTLTAARMLSAARALHADVYHLHDPELLPVGVRLRRGAAAVVYDAHEDLPCQVMSKHWIPTPLRSVAAALTGAIEKACVVRTQTVVAATPTIARRLVAFANQVATVRNYPLLEEFDDPPDFESRRDEACYIGGITVLRGLPEIVRGCGLAGVTLHLAGSREPGVMRVLERTPGWDRVVDHGLLPRRGVQDLLARVRVGLVTLKAEPNVVEALPVKMFEYMAAGVPLVASNFPLWKQIVETAGCGICVDPSDPEEIAAAIRTVLDDLPRARKMGANGRTAVLSSYNWRIEERSFLAFYRSLTAS